MIIDDINFEDIQEYDEDDLLTLIKHINEVAVLYDNTAISLKTYLSVYRKDILEKYNLLITEQGESTNNNLCKYRLVINGTVHKVDKDDIIENYFGNLPKITTVDGEEFIIANRENAEEAVRDYWKDMVNNDEREFKAIMGEERLMNWALNKSDSFGISSFDEFIERVGQYCEEDLAREDGYEHDVTRIGVLATILDVSNGNLHAYRV